MEPSLPQPGLTPAPLGDHAPEVVGSGAPVATDTEASTRQVLRELDAGQPLTVRQTTLWGDTLRRFARSKAAMISMGILVVLVIYAIVGPWIRPYKFDEGLNTDPLLKPHQLPNVQHWFGTDMAGRDLFVRTAMGGRVSLLVALAATTVVLFIGVLYGATAGSAGGRTDNVMMRFVDVLYGLPYLPFAIIMLVILGNGIVPMLLALAIVGWLTAARLVRGQLLTLKQNEYVEAARALGASRSRIVFRHLLPNTLGIIVVAMFLEIPGMILGEAILSFLGLGIAAPNASWGTLAQDGWQALRSYPWLIILPGFFIAVTVLAFNFVGDGFRDAIDPRTKETK